MGNLVFQATLGGQVNLVGPNTASTFNLNVPAVAGTLVTTGDTGTVTNTMLASSAYTAPGTIGSGTPNSGAFTTLSASSTVSGTGFSTYLASPPAIGGTAAAAGSFTALSYTTTLTGGTGIVNLGSGQFYKDASGNVGIGTSSPSTYGGKLAVRQTTDQVFFVSGNNLLSDGVSLNSVNDANGANKGLELRGSVVGFTTQGVLRGQFDSSGNLLVGTTTTYATNSRFSVFVANNTSHGITLRPEANAAYRAVNFNNSAGSANVGFIDCSTTTTTYSITSDYRLKENIVPLTGALAKIGQLKPSIYNYKVEPDKPVEGFIAHELQEVVPHAVTGEKDAVDADGNPIYQGVDASFLIPHLVAAIQEQQAIIEQLRADVAELKAPK